MPPSGGALPTCYHYQPATSGHEPWAWSSTQFKGSRTCLKRDSRSDWKMENRFYVALCSRVCFQFLRSISLSLSLSLSLYFSLSLVLPLADSKAVRRRPRNPFLTHPADLLLKGLLWHIWWLMTLDNYICDFGVSYGTCVTIVTPLACVTLWHNVTLWHSKFQEDKNMTIGESKMHVEPSRIEFWPSVRIGISCLPKVRFSVGTGISFGIQKGLQFRFPAGLFIHKFGYTLIFDHSTIIFCCRERYISPFKSVFDSKYRKCL
jgi:hypothetical protein